MRKDPFEDRGMVVEEHDILKNEDGIQVTRSFQTTSSHGSQTAHSVRRPPHSLQPGSLGANIYIQDWHEMNSKKSQETFV